MIEKKQIPNFLTLSRVIIIPFFIACFYLEEKTAAIATTSLFALASLTDFFDGWLARKFAVESGFGKFLDPIADKLIVASALFMLVHLQRADVVASIIIISREILVSGMREFLGKLKIDLPVTGLAKVKTTIQMFAVFFLLLNGNIWGEGGIMNIIDDAATGLLWLAALLTSITGFNYIKQGLKYM